MNIVESVARLIEDEFLFELGKDLFIGAAPREDVRIPHIWLVWQGGFPVRRNQTGEMAKQHNIGLFYRSEDPKDVYDFLQQLERFFNSADCKELLDFVTLEMSTISFPSDEDIDVEGMTIGTMSIQVQVYE